MKLVKALPVYRVTVILTVYIAVPPFCAVTTISLPSTISEPDAWLALAPTDKLKSGAIVVLLPAGRVTFISKPSITEADPVTLASKPDKALPVYLVILGSAEKVFI
ncbi:MAG: hypothetical protein HRT66_13190 [Flavobacteriaceae bacterium]|nr:hypothetical protein [Flavobacteriaceae bacterium]